MASMDYENENGTRYEGTRATSTSPIQILSTAYDKKLTINQRTDEAPRYEGRERSASPRPTRRNDSPRGPRRSASPNGNGHADSRAPKSDRGPPADDGAVNPGSNLFVTGIHPRLSEPEVTRLFEKYGDVEKCQIMLDPHTKESRGFGFVKMVTAEQADAAKEGLQGEVIEGRTLSIEKARRSRPRTPTPGKYFGPPKRDDPRGPPPRFGDRYDDRRGGGYRGRDDYGGGYRGYRGDDRGGDRGYGRRDRDDGYGRVDRYGGGGRDDRYGRGDDRRGGGGYSDRYERGDRDGRSRDAAPPAQYGDPAPRVEPREPYGGRDYDDDRYSRNYR
ncbi:transformer-SR ribonucleoprotein recognition motif containing protein [Coleophoma cylindrospora]|uniref:Transformer-SR ribonucleoprotein recognition motif containing protein n=1 Tax=Coleophoma cylindrospora TaxID=1849047 RepID=A0A3D8RAX4_9HELO|nr:transformer-SR ribonucleoprotein recognition motif containing protein [Coleophoma cylindrospora]